MNPSAYLPEVYFLILKDWMVLCGDFSGEIVLKVLTIHGPTVCQNNMC